MKIRVVQIVATMRDGGAEAIVRGLVPRLAALPDLDLHVISIYDSRLSAPDLAALGAPVIEMNRSMRRDLTFAPRLISTLRKLKPDVVHGHIHTGKFVGRIAAIAAGVPSIVFTEHGDEAHGIVHWAANRLLNARTTRFIVFTEDERRRYAKTEAIPLSRIDVIPNGIVPPGFSDVAATRAELKIRENEIVIGTPARLVSQKNQQLALRAVAHLRSNGLPVRFVIIGDGSDSDMLRALASQLNISEAVDFLGYRSDAQRLIAACDAIALPSIWEKMPLVFGEAMFAGVPIVSTPWTGVNAFIDDGETGFVARDWTVESFAQAMMRSIEKRPERDAIIARARRTAETRFDIARMVDAHATLYREIAGQRQAPGNDSVLVNHRSRAQSGA